MPRGVPKEPKDKSSKSTATKGSKGAGKKRSPSAYPRIPTSVFAAIPAVAKASRVPARELTSRLKDAYYEAIREAIEAVSETMSAASIAKQIVADSLDALGEIDKPKTLSMDHSRDEGLGESY